MYRFPKWVSKTERTIFESETLCMRRGSEKCRENEKMRACFILAGPHYKRTAKPKKTLPKRAARPRPALGMKREPAPVLLLLLPLLLPLLPVGSAPPKPVTGMVLLAVPDGFAVEAMVVGREVLPR